MNEEKSVSDKISSVMLIVVLIVFFFFVGYDIAHLLGYQHGATIAQLYYEETGRFPSEDALMEWEDKHWPETPSITIDASPYRGRP